MDALSDGTDVFETFFTQVRVGLALAGLDTRYMRVNDTYAALLRRPPEDVIGLPFTEVLHEEDRPAEDDRVQLLLAGQERSMASEERYLAEDGTEVWVLHAVTVVTDEAGQPAWFAVSAQDVTERRRAETDLRELTAVLAERAVRDPLTGLANRTLLQERLRAVLARDARTGASTALLFLDLDGFKAVNDTHGHAVGDQVLRAVASRLSRAVRPSDTVARLGGDEFVVLCEATAADGVATLVERLVEAVAQPVVVGRVVVGVGVSVGVAVSTAGEDDAGALVSRADQDMYRAKRAGVPRPPRSWGDRGRGGAAS